MADTEDGTYKTFNLSILECKLSPSSHASALITTFNLSILECKWERILCVILPSRNF